MTDRDVVMGSCFLHLDNGKATILKLDAGDYDLTEKPDMEQSFILDSLIRSAASYAETKGSLHVETAFPDFHGFFKRMGFQTDNDHAFGTVGVIIKYSAS